MLLHMLSSSTIITQIVSFKCLLCPILVQHIQLPSPRSANLFDIETDRNMGSVLASNTVFTEIHRAPGRNGTFLRSRKGGPAGTICLCYILCCYPLDHSQQMVVLRLNVNAITNVLAAHNCTLLTMSFYCICHRMQSLVCKA